jgi:hypothetical protein
MEDIIPVLIVVVLLLDVAELRAEFDLMIDYISFENREMEAEKRLLINFSVKRNRPRNPITTSHATGNLPTDRTASTTHQIICIE